MLRVVVILAISLKPIYQPVNRTCHVILFEDIIRTYQKSIITIKKIISQSTSNQDVWYCHVIFRIICPMQSRCMRQRRQCKLFHDQWQYKHICALLWES